MTRSWSSALGALGALCLSACTLNPLNGATSSGSNHGKSIPFSGYATSPGATMTVQVLSSASADPHGPSPNWITLATTQASQTAQVFGGDALYAWSANVVPVPGHLQAGRWPAGGVARLRVLQGSDLAFTFDDLGCVAAHAGEGAAAVAEACQSHDNGILTLVDVDPAPVMPMGYEFLGKKATALSEAQEYYAEVNAGPGTLRRTLAGWKIATGFSGAGGIAVPNNEIVTRYYNAGDLGLGRQMHCRRTTLGQSGNFYEGVACHVTNFGSATDGLADQATAVDQAIANDTPGATVTMEYDPQASHDLVRFYVYGADGSILPDLQLDTQSAKAVPGVCLACHGGNYDPNTNRVTNAQFLPFDVDSFTYSTQAAHTLSAQQEKFRELNEMVRQTTAANSPVRGLIDGWYGNHVSTNGTLPDVDYTPSGWDTAQDRPIYHLVVRPYCRTCHVAMSGALAFTSAADFALLEEPIKYDACQSKAMPHAEVTQKAFWESGARAHLIGGLGLSNASGGAFDGCDAD